MWAGGIAICTYLFFSPEKSSANSYTPVIPVTKNISNPNNLQDNEAYVFINVNEKHFLTRFVASAVPEEVKTTAKKNNNQPVNIVNTSVERVSKKPQPAAPNNVAGFSIKPVPGT
jgi:hypothetical protein